MTAPRPPVSPSAGAHLGRTVHEGGYDDIEAAYRSLGLWMWIAEQARVPAGPAEEQHLVPPTPGGPAAEPRTEIA